MASESTREYQRAWYKANKEAIIRKRKEYQEANKEKIKAQRKLQAVRQKRYNRNIKLKKKYGISIEDFESMLEVQGHKCAICSTPQTEEKRGRLCVDHCHKTGKVRKLLCHKCNRALGLLKEDVPTIIKLAQYVKEHS